MIQHRSTIDHSMYVRIYMHDDDVCIYTCYKKTYKIYIYTIHHKIVKIRKSI